MDFSSRKVVFMLMLFVICFFDTKAGQSIRLIGPVIVTHGSSVTLDCTIKANKSEVGWLLPNNLTLNSANLRLSANRMSLTIPFVNVTHAGLYSCCLSSQECARASLTVLLFSSGERFDPSKARYGDLHVGSDGWFEIQIHRDKRAVEETVISSNQKPFCESFMAPTVCRRFNEQTLSTYGVHNATVASSGWYTISVVFENKTASYYLNILIDGKPQLQMNDQTVLFGATSAKFTCQGFAYPAKVNFKFQFVACGQIAKESCSDKTGLTSVLNSSYVTDTEQSANVTGVVEIPGPIKDWGTVLCTASNEKGNASTMAFLYTRNFQEPMKLAIVLPSREIVYGDVVVVQCQVDVYNFSNQFKFRHGKEEHVVTGHKDRYAWVANHTITSIQHDLISCAALLNAGGHMTRTIRSNIVYDDTAISSNYSHSHGFCMVWSLIACSICFVLGACVILLYICKRKPPVNSSDYELQSFPSEYEFSAEKLKLGELIGEGAFGIVRKAVAQNIFVHEPTTTVAVKTMKKCNVPSLMNGIVLELHTMIDIGQHLNVVNFLGAVTKHKGANNIMLIFEYCRHGSLETFMRNNKARFIERTLDLDTLNTPTLEAIETALEGSEKQFNTTDLICWSAQVAHGMAYVSSKNILHGDIAARNVLLTDNNVVKISDFGLSRTLQSGVYRKTGDSPVPYKWLALESLVDHIFSVNTDVWAFGVFLWELYSLGAAPYSNVNGKKELLELLQNGYRMDQPAHCNRDIFDIMLSCWYVRADLRPRFVELAAAFDAILPPDQRNHYIAMSDHYLQINTMKAQQNDEYKSSVQLPPLSPTRTPEPRL